jgi:hypothetical protein
MITQIASRDEPYLLPVTEEQEEDRCVAIGLVGSGRSVDFGPEEEFVAEQRRLPPVSALFRHFEFCPFRHQFFLFRHCDCIFRHRHQRWS